MHAAAVSGHPCAGRQPGHSVEPAVAAKVAQEIGGRVCSFKASEYKFINEDFALIYRTEQRMGSVLKYFSFFIFTIIFLRLDSVHIQEFCDFFLF